MSRYNSGRFEPGDPRYRLPQARPGMLDREPRRTHDRPFELDADLSVLDDNGDVLLSVHQLPRSVHDGMDLVLRDATGTHAAKVVDIDRFYGLVAARLEG